MPTPAGRRICEPPVLARSHRPRSQPASRPPPQRQGACPPMARANINVRMYTSQSGPETQYEETKSINRLMDSIYN